jgi:hypothetical protein
MDATTLYLLSNLSLDGWSTESLTCTYASANTFKILGIDTTKRYTVGTKFACTDAANTKYFYVVSSYFSTDTTVTITGGSDYTLSGGAITNPMYSYMATPYGFPGSFTVSLSPTGWTTAGLAQDNHFSINGRSLWLVFNIYNTSNAAGATKTGTLPVASAFATEDVMATCRVEDNAAVPNTPGMALITHATTTILFYKDCGGGTAWTGNGNCFVNGEITYPI